MRHSRTRHTVLPCVRVVAPCRRRTCSQPDGTSRLKLSCGSMYCWLAAATPSSARAAAVPDSSSSPAADRRPSRLLAAAHASARCCWQLRTAGRRAAAAGAWQGRAQAFESLAAAGSAWARMLLLSTNTGAASVWLQVSGLAALLKFPSSYNIANVGPGRRCSAPRSVHRGLAAGWPKAGQHRSKPGPPRAELLST